VWYVSGVAELIDGPLEGMVVKYCIQIKGSKDKVQEINLLNKERLLTYNKVEGQHFKLTKVVDVTLN